MNISRRASVRAVLRDSDRYLLAQHNNTNPIHVGKWGIPGGRLENGETDLEEALRREIREEFGVEIIITGFIGLYEYNDRNYYIYLAAPASIDFLLDRSEILDFRWVTVEEVAAWQSADRLHSGFELDAIKRSLDLFPLS